MSDTRKKLELLDAALSEEIDDDEAREAVTELGIDVKAAIARIHSRIAKAAADERAERFAAARRDRLADAARLDRRPIQRGPRAEQLAIFEALIAKAPAKMISANFHKYESADPDDLARMIRDLKHLLGEDEDE